MNVIALTLTAVLALAPVSCEAQSPTGRHAAAQGAGDGVVPPYERDAFGDGWASTGGGCDTRDVILRRDVEAVTNADRCGPLAGTLRDPYTGVVVVGPTRQLDIDHVVPLFLAWSLGAWRWTPEQREAFANSPDNLQTTSARINRSKGDKGLDEWLPRRDRCGYASRFDAVADRYGLADDTRDGVVARACR